MPTDLPPEPPSLRAVLRSLVALAPFVLGMKLAILGTRIDPLWLPSLWLISLGTKLILFSRWIYSGR